MSFSDKDIHDIDDIDAASFIEPTYLLKLIKRSSIVRGVQTGGGGTTLSPAPKNSLNHLASEGV